MVQQHFATRISRMPFKAFRSRIETVRDPEVVNQWLEKMKKVTRYTLKGPVAEGQTAPSFDSLEDARAHLLASVRDSVVKRRRQRALPRQGAGEDAPRARS